MKKAIIALCVCVMAATTALSSCSTRTYSGKLFGAVRDDSDAPPPEDSLHASSISFDGTSYEASDSSAIAVGEGGEIIIIKSGKYTLSGNRMGQLQISISKEEDIILELDGVNITCDTGSPLYIKSAGRVYINALGGTKNAFEDGEQYALGAYETKPNACIYSADDIFFYGDGEIEVKGNYNNGVSSNNDIVFVGARVTVCAKNNAVKGEESVSVKGGAHLAVTDAEDAIKSDSINPDKGFVLISSGAVVEISCLDDGITAMQKVTIEEGARVSCFAGGKVINCDGLDGNGGEVSVADGTLSG